MFGGGFLQGGNNNYNNDNYGGGSYNGGGGNFLGGGGGSYNGGGNSYNAGGNNYNSGAGGNRFQGSEAKGNAGASPFKTDQKKKGSIIPLTLKALVDISSRQDDALEIDNTPVEQAVVIGRVYNVEEQSTRILFYLDDSTARAQVAYYKKSDLESNGAMGFEISDFRENKYVKAVIVVRPFKQQKVLVAHLLQPVNDYNQITYHFLSTFLSSAYRVKGPLEKSDPNFKNDSSFNRDQGQQQQGGMGQYQQQNNNFSGNSFPMMQGGQNPSKPFDMMTYILNTVRQVMNQDSNGMCRESQLLQRLGGRVKHEELKNALIRLESNGQIHRSFQDDRDPGFVAL